MVPLPGIQTDDPYFISSTLYDCNSVIASWSMFCTCSCCGFAANTMILPHGPPNSLIHPFLRSYGIRDIIIVDIFWFFVFASYLRPPNLRRYFNHTDIVRELTAWKIIKKTGLSLILFPFLCLVA